LEGAGGADLIRNIEEKVKPGFFKTPVEQKTKAKESLPGGYRSSIILKKLRREKEARLQRVPVEQIY
jgi:hypothetical protein